MLFWGLWHLYWRRRQRPCEPIFTRKIRGLRFVTFWNLMRWCDERNMDDTVAHVTGLMLAHVHCRQVKKPGKWSLRLGRKTYGHVSLFILHLAFILRSWAVSKHLPLQLFHSGLLALPVAQELLSAMPWQVQHKSGDHEIWWAHYCQRGWRSNPISNPFGVGVRHRLCITCARPCGFDSLHQELEGGVHIRWTLTGLVLCWDLDLL